MRKILGMLVILSLALLCFNLGYVLNYGYGLVDMVVGYCFGIWVPLVVAIVSIPLFILAKRAEFDRRTDAYMETWQKNVETVWSDKSQVNLYIELLIAALDQGYINPKGIMRKVKPSGSDMGQMMDLQQMFVEAIRRRVETRHWKLKDAPAPRRYLIEQYAFS